MHFAVTLFISCSVPFFSSFLAYFGHFLISFSCFLFVFFHYSYSFFYFVLLFPSLLALFGPLALSFSCPLFIFLYFLHFWPSLVLQQFPFPALSLFSSITRCLLYFPLFPSLLTYVLWSFSAPLSCLFFVSYYYIKCRSFLLLYCKEWSGRGEFEPQLPHRRVNPPGHRLPCVSSNVTFLGVASCLGGRLSLLRSHGRLVLLKLR